jgi:hypothetical protein
MDHKTAQASLKHGHGQEKVTRFQTVAALEAKLAGTQATTASPMGRPRSGGPLERSWKRQTAESLSQTSHAPEVAGSRAAVPIGERPRSAWLVGRDSVVCADEYRQGAADINSMFRICSLFASLASVLVVTGQAWASDEIPSQAYMDNPRADSSMTGDREPT